MTSDAIVRLLAEPRRLRVLAAVALGADQSVEVANRTGLSRKDVLVALRRLRQGGLITAEDGGGLRVDYRHLRLLARESAGQNTESAERAGQDTESAVQAALRPFVRGGRLLTLPAQQARRRVVLEHIAGSFEPGETFDERTVNERLRKWCAEGTVDHVAVRRYLVDAGILVRVNGVYSRSRRALPEPGAAERYVAAMGLD